MGRADPGQRDAKDAQPAPANDAPAKPDAKAADANPVAANPADKKAAGAKPADAPPADANGAQRPVGHLIRVPVPIELNADTRVRSAISHLRATMPKGGPRPVLVFEFDPETEGGRGSDFSRALSLAHMIALNRDLAGVKTVAYIPKTIEGHAVLVAMACEEIIMAPNAEIGDAGIDETVIGATIRSAYQEIAEARKNIPPALALGMLDKNVRVLKVLTEQGTDIILASDLDKLKKQRAVLKTEELSPVPGLYSGIRGRTELGFVSYLADDRQAVAKELGLAPNSLRDDPSLGGQWQAVRIPLRGVITQALITETESKIRDQIDNHANFICLWIDSAGGSLEQSQRLAGYLADLPSDKVRTVAYIPEKARGDAALMAIACDQIVAGPEAIIGGSGDVNIDHDDLVQVDRIIRDIAEKKHISWSIPEALFDPEIKIYRYSQRDRGMQEFVSPEEIAARPDAAAWKQGEMIWQGGSPWRLSGQRGEEYGFVWHTVDNFNEFKHLYGLEKDVQLVEPGWADYLISALSSPSMLGILMFLGLAGVIAELYSPGLGIGAFVAIVAFMLYFWILHLHGTAGWLVVLLFLAGVCCLLLEIFVLPGFAIFGLGGGLMIIASLVLASQTSLLPRNDYQWEQLETTLASLGGAVVGAFVAAIAFRRFLPHAPVFNRVFLQPFSGEERQNLATRESLVDFAHLVGRGGTTVTPLMPSGKARFGDQLLDVIADGEAIDRGEAVVVVEVRGNRVLVHRAAAEQQR
ncbi:MAG TPA: NfeD family protein [Pirellulales bacterium]|nr:NfeD family protein [Pirellulales bacterium]